jgi:NAD(P)-dependent dehydrogenase (short-subunit alcohol dehydrogenase family)
MRDPDSPQDLTAPGEASQGWRLCREKGRPVRAEICDLTDREAVRRGVGGLGALDVLVNNAGLELITPILEPGEAVERAFLRIIEINVIGAYCVTREAVPLMSRGGSIVLTSSIWGRTGAAEFLAYVASKHASLGLMCALAKELGPKGIRVNAVCPGWVRTRAALRSLERLSARAGVRSAGSGALRRSRAPPCSWAGRARPS